MNKTVELDIPTDPAERVRRQAEYDRMKAPLPSWLGPDTPERRMELQMFVDMLADDEKSSVNVEDGEPITEENPAVLRAMVHFHREDARLARDELVLSQAHRKLVPVITMQAIADAIVARVGAISDWSNPEAWPSKVEIAPRDLQRIIMEEFDKELG